MPLVPMSVDSSTVAVTSAITAVITYYFSKGVLQFTHSGSIVAAVVVGLVLYGIGVIPIGLLLVIGFSMIVAIFKHATRTTSPTNTQTDSQLQIPSTNSAKLDHAVTQAIQRGKARRQQSLSVDDDILAKRSLYEVIGVSKNASKKEIEAACLRLGEQFRSEKKDSQNASERFAEIETAYETLLDDKRRSEYNKRLIDTIDEKKSRVFILEGENPMSPKMFGLTSVTIAIDTSPIPIRVMIGNGQSLVQKEISSKAHLARFHLVALYTAGFYVYADKLIGVPKDVLSEVYEGIVERATTFCAEKDGNPVEGMPELFDTLFRLYAGSLYKELEEIGNKDGSFLDVGPTAVLVAKMIATQCGIDTLVSDNALERVRLEEIGAKAGILWLLTLWKRKFLTFVS